MATAAAAGWLSAADRLALLLQRYGVAEDKVAQQLGWPLEQLRAYVSPEARRQQAASDVVDTKVDRLLMRYRVSLAHRTVASSLARPVALADASARRSSAPPLFAHGTSDHRSIIRPQPTPEQLQATAEHVAATTTTGVSSPTGRRKRKRKVLALELATPNSAMQDARQLLASRPASSDLVCPVRLDVDVDGVRYQDTFLVNALNPTSSPDVLAAQIAADERLPNKVKDAIAESIRRQLMAFCVHAASQEAHPKRLYPIYLDVIVEGLSLRDQFEWDITNDFGAVQTFASTLCVDLNLSPSFESAIVFAMWEQVVAYRSAMHCRKWIGTKASPAKLGSSSSGGYLDAMPPLQVEDAVRNTSETVIWQPVLSELSKEERQYLAAKFGATRVPFSQKPHPVAHVANGRQQRRHQRVVSKEHKAPRPINPFIMYCQIQKDIVAKSNPRRSASETRKIMGDMWRKCTDEEKEYYGQLTEVENEKRRREHVLEVRDRAIAEWEEDEARRKGLLSSGVLDASTEYFRGLLLENYMSERHDVDANRQAATVDEDVEPDE